jgi:hypothetical protein
VESVKIFKNEDSYENELLQVKKAEKFDPEAKYFNPMVKSCRVTDIDDSDKNKCTWTKEPNKEYYQIIYKYKGVDFDKYLKTRKYSFRDIVSHLVGFAEMVRITLIWISKHLICL